MKNLLIITPHIATKSEKKEGQRNSQLSEHHLKLSVMTEEGRCHFNVIFIPLLKSPIYKNKLFYSNPDQLQIVC